VDASADLSSDLQVCLDLNLHCQNDVGHTEWLQCIVCCEVVVLRGGMGSDLKSSVLHAQDLQFKLTAYASSICPMLQHQSAPRSSAGCPWPERTPSGDLSHVLWPGMRQRGF
jgi:hypothetical protein